MILSNLYLDPIAAVEQPRKDLIRYLLTAYPLRDPHLRYGLKKQLEQPGTIWQYPYLEGSQPYQSANSIQELIEMGVLHPNIADLFVPAQRPLYEHQEKAVRAIVEKQQNIVVATGTGSGKTECFLIPIIDQLLKEGEKLLSAKPGVRVLILYPMNALVNDQVKRLRQLLCHQKKPLIRFGFYTSRTEKEERKAQKMLKGELAAYAPEDLQKLLTAEQLDSLPPNQPESIVEQAVQNVRNIQVISRESFWEDPPHILLTNYSMLEHMMIRPIERSKIFEASKDSFQFLIVDEAHSYNGATGTEVTLLLKRLKSAIGIEKEGAIRCIATSASLGDKSVDSSVLQFAEALFGEEFSQVIRGDRVTAKDRLGEPYFTEPELSDRPIWEDLQRLTPLALEASLEEWSTQLSYFVPRKTLQAAQEQVKGLESTRDRTHQFLWFALKQNPLFHRLINLLCQVPAPWYEIAQSTELWATELPKNLDGKIEPKIKPQLEKALAYLVQVGSLARKNPDDLPLLPVRLHLLFRSLEGVYACINSTCPGAEHDPNSPNRSHRYGKLYLNQKNTCDVCSSPVLELSSCRKCGQAYSLTSLSSDSQGSGILQPLPRSLEAILKSKQIYTLTVGKLDNITEDEEIEISEEDSSSLIGTFMIHQQGQSSCWQGIASRDKDDDTLDTSNFVLNWHLPSIPSGTKKANLPKSWEGGYLHKCPACGARTSQNPPIGRFVSYTDAPLEVLLDSLFTLLPDTSANWQSEQPTKRKLLTFSDGRQDAAFFASDFQRTHTETLYRQMVWRAFQSVKDGQGSASVGQVENKLTEKFLEISLPHPDRDAQKHHQSYVPYDPNELIEGNKAKNPKDCQIYARKRAKELLLREFGLPSARRFSIEALGLLSCHLDFHEQAIQDIAERFRLTDIETRIFLQGLFDITRKAGIIDLQGASTYFPETGGLEGGFPATLDQQGRSLNRIKLAKDEGEKRVVSFLWRSSSKPNEPAKQQNQLVEYYRHVLGESIKQDDIIWLFDALIKNGWLTPCQKGGYQINWRLLNIIETDQYWYQCNSCQQRFHLPELENFSEQIKPHFKQCLAYKCKGRLYPFTPLKNDQDDPDHYRHLIQQRPIIPLRSQEHTAQLSVIELEKRENYFRQGKINLLSSSTTLEMGVDIGELQAVILRNFPPYVSNYQQRAGRAGRRTDGVSVTLMYGQRRPHDRYYFEQPALLIAGKNQIPQLDPDNFQIQQRHIRAELLAAFLREEQGKGAEKISIGDFLGLSMGDSSPVDPDQLSSDTLICQFQEWLKLDRTRQLTQQWLLRLASQHTEIEVLTEFENVLNSFAESQLQDWNQLAEVLQELVNDIRYTSDRQKRRAMENKRDRLENELDKIAKRRLHDQLAQASILPIYGFPIDVVRLLTGESERFQSFAGKHRLERDRRLALGEYAPGQDIVVDDRVHRSVGILSPNDLERQFYWVCKNCNYFTKSMQEPEPFECCPECNYQPEPLERKFKEYIVPKTFITDWSEDPKVTPYTKPLRQPTSQVFLAQDGENSRIFSSSEHYKLICSQGGLFFLANQGSLFNGRGFKNRGFAICKGCGRDLSDAVRAKQTNKSKKNSQIMTQSSQFSHNHPLTGKPCSSWSYEYLHLGHEFRSDLLKICFSSTAIGNRLLFVPIIHFGDDRVIASIEEESMTTVTGLGFWYSLTYALLAAAAEIIDVPRSELDGLFRPTEAGNAEIVIHDNVPGGAGYSQRIAERFQEVLVKAYQLIESCNCDSSCYDCLRTYSNQRFHAELNRHVVAEFLQPLVE